ncbi:MAG: hypothetical protein SGI77_24930 [Pirellulaceae bacterium]|nr:hypothetical protein [Pirellulaceae bacterium]
MKKTFTIHIASVCLLGVTLAANALGQMDFEGPPIRYGEQASRDRVAMLAEALDKGAIRLEEDEQLGLLPSLLKALAIPPESQTLVFSKTSFQLHKIGPDRPRAVYFNDDTYVGWVRDSRLLELGAVDNDQGAVFYSMDTPLHGSPRIVRDQGQCLICHANQRTQAVPGFLVRSVYSNPVGHFVSGTPAYVTDHTSPFSERWGGWYVTGKHGEMPHLGNSVCVDESLPGWIDPKAGLNQTQLPDEVSPSEYYAQSSDIVALMVLEHQTQMHNFITRASFEARTAAYQDAGINKALERPEDYQSESTVRRIASVGEKLVRYLLMADEFELTSPVQGSSRFTEVFSKRGARDSQNRSLYALDLQRRLFKYPCSYLIYSKSFDALPHVVLEYVGQRLNEILLSDIAIEGYEKLSLEDRQAIVSILRETKADFWTKYVAGNL